jgi:hypothetical protein
MLTELVNTALSTGPKLEGYLVNFRDLDETIVELVGGDQIS